MFNSPPSNHLLCVLLTALDVKGGLCRNTCTPLLRLIWLKKWVTGYIWIMSKEAAGGWVGNVVMLHSMKTGAFCCHLRLSNAAHQPNNKDVHDCTPKFAWFFQMFNAVLHMRWVTSPWPVWLLLSSSCHYIKDFKQMLGEPRSNGHKDFHTLNEKLLPETVSPHSLAYGLLWLRRCSTIHFSYSPTCPFSPEVSNVMQEQYPCKQQRRELHWGGVQCWPSKGNLSKCSLT